MLNNNELNRYSRHLLLPEVGKEGQERLKASRVLVIGAGGLGCPILLYLVAAGIGTVGIVDFDLVDESNLQRQVLFTTDSVGKSKALEAKLKLEEMNPLITINSYHAKLTAQNAIELFQSYDIIVDGSDNFETRYVVNDACILANKPLVYGAIFKFEGQVSVFNYQHGPSYRCLFPSPPPSGSVPNCAEIGVLGVLPGIIGSFQANEVLKMVLGIGRPLSGKLLMYNALNAESSVIGIPRDERVINEVLQKGKIELVSQVNCGLDDEQSIESLSPEEFDQLLHNEAVQLLDVREIWEEPKLELSNIINIPLQLLPKQMHLLEASKKMVVFCQKGGRSLKAIKILKKNHFKSLLNLTGGVENYIQYGEEEN